MWGLDYGELRLCAVLRVQGLLNTNIRFLIKKLYAWSVTIHRDLPS